MYEYIYMLSVYFYLIVHFDTLHRGTHAHTLDY